MRGDSMIILWSKTETGKIYKATDINEIPNGAFMFSLEGTYLGIKAPETKSEPTPKTMTIHLVDEHYIIETDWNDLLN